MESMDLKSGPFSTDLEDVWASPEGAASWRDRGKTPPLDLRVF